MPIQTPVDQEEISWHSDWELVSLMCLTAGMAQGTAMQGASHFAEQGIESWQHDS